ncbi:MAG: phosphotransferase [Acidobacteria bacterium]|nr:phosphotransferase [Acidobacteriota bacterium]
MFELDESKLQVYLSSVFRERVRLLGVSLLGEPRSSEALKGYGYGVPVRLECEVSGRRQSVVLETISPGPFDHQHMADRARILLWSHHTYNQLPQHAHSLDVGGFGKEGELLSLRDVREFFILNEYVSGQEYFHDLERLRDGGCLADLDTARADALCNYLVEIHRERGRDPELYIRRVRELVGHGECIMGILDGYPARFGFITSRLLEEIEHFCVRWRWKLKSYTHRLRQVHGDFHPWNILFREGTDFTVLDRARGEWGEPADDVASLTMNYLFFSLQRGERLEGNLEILFRRFWERYLQGSGEQQILEVAAPFFAFRALVMASPVWYPTLRETVRQKLFAFARAVLESQAFDPEQVNRYCGS